MPAASSRSRNIAAELWAGGPCIACLLSPERLQISTTTACPEVLAVQRLLRASRTESMIASRHRHFLAKCSRPVSCSRVGHNPLEAVCSPTVRGKRQLTCVTLVRLREASRNIEEYINPSHFFPLGPYFPSSSTTSHQPGISLTTHSTTITILKHRLLISQHGLVR